MEFQAEVNVGLPQQGTWEPAKYLIADMLCPAILSLGKVKHTSWEFPGVEIHTSQNFQV